jgi:xanthine dehydrogenase accessory factor
LITGYPAELQSRAADLRSGRQPFVVATVVRAARPTSAKPGDRALVLADGTIEGFAGGACAESSLRLHGLRVLRSGEAVMLRIVPGPVPGTGAGDADGTEGTVTVANPCASGGTLEIFLEGVFPPPLVQVCGDGPTARAIRELGTALGYEMRAAGPGTDPVLPDAAAVVVASHGRDEEPVLRAALDAGVPYIGLVASRRRGAQVLAALDLGADAAARVHTPAGLDIGARTLPEIALSIFAQIVSERPRAPGAPATGAAVPGTPGARAQPATATDPVCGMAVAVTESSLRMSHDGQMWYFCGPGCRQAFAAEPGRYLQ